MNSVRESFLGLSVVLVACWSGTAGAQEIVTFPDQNLEIAIRSALAKPTGPLTSADLGRLGSLSAGRRNIRNLSGLEGSANLTNLDLSGNAISDLLPLTGLSNLVQLKLDRNRIGDLSPLAGLLNLAALDLGGNQIANAGVLAALPQMSDLRLGDNVIGDLSFVSGLGRLRSLELDDNLIVDLSPLTALTNLTLLSLSGNPIGDCSPLGGLPQLSNLSLRNVGIESLAALQNLTQLVALNLERNRIRDLSPLAKMVNLSDLNLRWNRVTNYAGVLAGFTNLTVLYFGGNAISNVACLKNLSRLTFLNLGENAIPELAPIAGLTNLTYLVLSGNPISNYTLLSGLSGIVNLELRGNSISNLNFISPLHRLGYLDLAYNQINDFSPLALLTNLHSVVIAENRLTNSAGLSLMGSVSNLWLDGNSLSDVSGLTNLSQLTGLSLGDNLISDPAPLGALTNLTSLGLSRNPVANYDGLAGLTNLGRLRLNGNSISNLGFISGLTGLQNLELQNNRITDLVALSGLTNLVALFADYNRLTNIAGLSNLPRLSRVQLVGNPLEVSAEVTATNLAGLQLRGVELAYLPTNQPPSVGMLTNWFIPVNESSSLSFSLADDVTPNDQLLLTIASANPGLISDASLLLSGTNGNRTLTVTPSFNQTGTAILTLTALDEAGVGRSVSAQVSVLVPQPVSLPDPDLERAIRLTLDKPAGNLTSVDLLAVTGLFAFSPNLVSLAGLEFATNLTTIYLAGTAITNLAVLENLPHLTSLSLSDDPRVDYSSLAGLTNLTVLHLVGSPITNLAFLGTLTQLTDLVLANSRLTDVSPLTALTNLQLLDLSQNRLTNVGPLTNLPNLVAVDLRLNLFATDSDAGLPQLADHGVSVLVQPQRMPPILVTPDGWFASANTTSYLHFSAWNDGPPDEPFTITAVAPTGSLVPATNLFVNRATSGLAQDWILTVTPPTNYTGTSPLTFIATNEVGLSATVTVTLTIALPLPLNDQVLEETNLIWLTGGGAPWFGQTNISHAGGSAAQSGSLMDYQESWLAADLPGPGILSFWWKVSSEAGYDWLNFYLNDQLQEYRISGEVDWERVVTILPPGPQQVKWQYLKDENWAQGLDAAWLDEVSFVPLSWLALVGMPANGQCQLRLHLILGKRYILETSTNLAGWFPLSVMVATNTVMPFLDLTANSTMRYYRLEELSAGSIWLQNPTRVGNEFQLELHSPPGLRFEMQASTNLVDWIGLRVITNTSGTIPYTDGSATNSPLRFYRALLLP